MKITREDSHYPRLLQSIKNPPKALYLKGDAQVLDTPCFGVVGTRKASGQGLEFARRIAYDLAQKGLTIVSGLAQGIDGANLHKGVESSAWKLDYRRFRSWIRQKFGITDAFLFIGLMSKHADLYTSLQSMSYKLVFKEIVYDGSGKAKGNCDADLVLQAARDYYENPLSRSSRFKRWGLYASCPFLAGEESVLRHRLPRANRQVLNFVKADRRADYLS